MEKEYIFKASTVDMAIKNGLSDLGLSEEDVEIEVISEGGIFSKATVKITIKEQEEVEVVEEIVEEVEETAQVSSDDREQKFRINKELREKGKEFLKEMARLMGVSITVEGKVREDEINLFNFLIRIFFNFKFINMIFKFFA